MVDFNKYLSKNKIMANKENKATEEIPVLETASEVEVNNFIALRNQDALARSMPVTFDLGLAELDAELETAIQALGVQKITSPSSILNRLFNMTDAFYFDITEKDAPKTIIIYICQMVDSNEVFTVGQSVNGIRMKFVNAFDKVKIRGKQLVLTNLEFVERKDLRPTAGNYPISASYTQNTKPILTNRVSA